MEVNETLAELGCTNTEYVCVLSAHPVLNGNLPWAARFIRYCRERGLNPAGSDVIAKTETSIDGQILKIVPTIGAYRKIAHGTGQYAGMDSPVVGPMKEFEYFESPVRAPEFVTVTVYIMVDGQRCPVPATEYWEEAVVLNDLGQPYQHWRDRPIGQLTVRAESQALRKAFSLCDGYIVEEQAYIDAQVHKKTSSAKLGATFSNAMNLLNTVHDADSFSTANTYCEEHRNKFSSIELRDISNGIREALVRINQQNDRCDDVPV